MAKANSERGLVLVVDDEQLIVDFLRTGLEYEGFEVKTAGDGLSALSAARSLHPDLVILDRMLPHMEGTEVCRRLREAGLDMPVLMLTAKGEIDDRVAGLDAGADDYLVKPFAFKELMARLRAVLRRRQPSTEAPLRVGPISLDPATREVHVEREEIALTPREFDLLELFMQHPRRVFPRDTILDHVWGYDVNFDVGGVALGIALTVVSTPAVAHGIVEAYAGTITAESAPGKGTTMTVRLPLGG